MVRNTLAPFLFIIVLDYGLRRGMTGKAEELGFTISPNKPRRHPNEVVAELDLQDALLSDGIKETLELAPLSFRNGMKEG